MKDGTPALIEEPAGVPTREGCYVCGRCHRVATPSQGEIDRAESRPEARVQLKCAHCHHRTVEWHVPSPIRPKPVPVPVDQERAGELFAKLKEAVT